jgi:peptidoglycan hydrolase-like protein with peptidoglycan-binding domain
VADAFKSRLAGFLALLGRPPVALTGSGLLVGAAIVTNALYMQPRPHPAPLVSTRYIEGASPVAEEPRAQRSDDLVLAVQSALRRTGHYGGPLDGLAGPQTREAILAFEAEAERPATGEASLELLAAIKTAKAGETDALAELAVGGQEEEPEHDSRVAAVQHALSIAAYGPLQADGVFGPQTREAILRFQRDHGLTPTGEISDALMVELRAAGALEE